VATDAIDRGETTVLIAYCSLRGHDERLAQAVAAGVRSVEGVRVSVKRVHEVSKEELLACDGLIVVSPVHSGSMAVSVKQVFDDWQFRFDFHPSRPLRDRVGGAFAAGGHGAGGRELTMLSILAAMLQHRMIVASGESPIGASAATEAKPEAIDAQELAEAHALGGRVAQVAMRVRSGRRRSQSESDSIA
jgi:NAD(P)H dehydrogenase (quinone)